MERISTCLDRILNVLDYIASIYVLHFYHFSQEDSFLKEREVSRWENELASNKGWQEAILIVRHTESVTPLPIEYTFGV